MALFPGKEGRRRKSWHDKRCDADGDVRSSAVGSDGHGDPRGALQRRRRRHHRTHARTPAAYAIMLIYPHFAPMVLFPTSLAGQGGKHPLTSTSSPTPSTGGKRPMSAPNPDKDSEREYANVPALPHVPSYMFCCYSCALSFLSFFVLFICDARNTSWSRSKTSATIPS